MNGVRQMLQIALKSRKLERENSQLFKTPKIIEIRSRSSELGPFEIWGFRNIIY